MKNLLVIIEDAAYLLLIWAALWVIGFAGFGSPKPWEWQDHGTMEVAMLGFLCFVIGDTYDKLKR